VSTRVKRGSTYDGEQVWFAAGDKLARLGSGERGRRCARLMSPRMQETAFRRPAPVFRLPRGRNPERSIRRPVVCSPRFPAPDGGGHSGLAWAEGTLWVGQVRGPEDLFKSIPKPGPFFAPSRPAVSSPEYLGRRRALATAPGKDDERRFEASRSSNGRGPGEARDAAWSRRCRGSSSDGGRSVSSAEVEARRGRLRTVPPDPGEAQRPAAAPKKPDRLHEQVNRCGPSRARVRPKALREGEHEDLIGILELLPFSSGFPPLCNVAKRLGLKAHSL